MPVQAPYSAEHHGPRRQVDPNQLEHTWYVQHRTGRPGCLLWDSRGRAQHLALVCQRGSAAGSRWTAKDSEVAVIQD